MRSEGSSHNRDKSGNYIDNLTRRRFIASVAATVAVALLEGCSKSGNKHQVQEARSATSTSQAPAALENTIHSDNNARSKQRI